MIVGQIHWLSTEEENTCPVFEEKSHKNKVRDCLPKTGAICLSAVIKLCFMFSYWPTVATSITASLLKQMIKEIPLLGITFFVCLWNLRLIFFRNLQKKFQNLGVLHQYWPIQDNVSNMALSYNKLWFFIFKAVSEGHIWNQICISIKTFIFIHFQIFPTKFLSK